MCLLEASISLILRRMFITHQTAKHTQRPAQLKRVACRCNGVSHAVRRRGRVVQLRSRRTIRRDAVRRLSKFVTR
eukprot:6185809-Pleurochrysis_carterae.AAC.1